MTPNQRHNRRMMIQLLVMAAAIMALSVAEERRAERDATREEASASTPQVAETYALGARAVLAPADSSESQEGGRESFLQVVSAAEFQHWLDTSASSEWESAVNDCLYSWWLLDQGIEGELGFEFEVDAQGFSRVSVRHHQTVPQGPANCLLAAMKQQSWPSTAGESLLAVKNWSFSSSAESTPSVESSADP